MDIPPKNRYAQTIKDAFSQLKKTIKRKPILLETDDWVEYVNRNLTKSWERIILIRRSSRYNSRGFVFAEIIFTPLHNFLRKPVLLEGNADWVKGNTISNQLV